MTGSDLKRQAELSGYVLRANLALIRQAPLITRQEVIWAFGSYWFPSAGVLANMGSRALQFCWVALHFLLMSAAWLNLILLVGVVPFVARLRRHAALANVETVRRLESQALVYVVALAIVAYTAGISCLVEVGDPRYRTPTDGLIVSMLFVGWHIWRSLIKPITIVSSSTFRSAPCVTFGAGGETGIDEHRRASSQEPPVPVR